ncbi:antibiotic biosynthesis monooxygenase [Nisaea sp.]|uniref:antibiotic biosynthesis monooxygenase family protein n=1 Tax=Nisaea sp. TaxID=2024842 RepID=UPI0032EC93BF
MIAVIFEVEPHPDHKDGYLEIAASMRALVDQVDGFISVERFQSLTNEGKLLSLSYFRDEKAVEDWRNLVAHRQAQAQGRSKYFKDYRLKVATILRDYGPNDRAEAPDDSNAAHIA